MTTSCCRGAMKVGREKPGSMEKPSWSPAALRQVPALMWETDHSGRFDPQTIFEWAASVLQPPKHQQGTSVYTNRDNILYHITFFQINEDHLDIWVVKKNINTIIKKNTPSASFWPKYRNIIRNMHLN